GGAVVPVDPQPDLTHRPEDVIAAMERSQAPLAVVCTPNNPTGDAFTADALRAMAEAAPGFLLIDEAYVEFQEGPTALDLLRELPQTIVMRTFSKAMGMAQLRLGYLLAHPDAIAEIEKARLPFLVDRLSEAAGIAMLEQEGLVRERARQLSAERERVVAALREREAVEVVPSSANFFILRTPLEAATLQERLLREGVRVRNVSGYPALSGGADGPGRGRFETGWVRVSVGTPDENSTFLAALDRVLAPAP
ncbi:MAG: aminotransferase class I/II-fold pyridoxal phosphate-dependent enzyme, partial [Rhodothermales bacterium]|nr:aminotransferase class I/II-fold pyridoxal phosphate-dependent enzyme [Rhodothermales bacterium]